MKKIIFFSVSCLSVFLLGACGKGGTSKGNESSTSNTSTEESSVTSSSKETNKSSSDWSKIQEVIKKETEAEKVNVLFESKEPIKNESEDAEVIVNGYQYLSIENFSNDYSITFGDQTKKGGILLISATYKNFSDSTLYASPNFTMQVTGFSRSIGRAYDMIDSSEDIISKLLENNSELKAGEEISGYVAMSVNAEGMDKINEYNEGKLEIPGIYTKKDSFNVNEAAVAPKEVNIPLSNEGADIVANDNSFYADKVTVDNLGKKTLLSEKEINETKEYSGVKVTFEGYQITEFVPNEDEARSFEGYDTGIILLTAKLNITNGSSENINIDQTAGTLSVAKDRMMNNGFLETISEPEELAPNAEGTRYIVFSIDKESYEKLYHDKEFTMSVNLYDKNMAWMNQGEEMLFTFKN